MAGQNIKRGSVGVAKAEKAVNYSKDAQPVPRTGTQGLKAYFNEPEYLDPVPGPINPIGTRLVQLYDELNELQKHMFSLQAAIHPVLMPDDQQPGETSLACEIGMSPMECSIQNCRDKVLTLNNHVTYLLSVVRL